MKKKQAKKKPPELKVVFDSNVLYTGSASDLLSREIGQLIDDNSNHPDLKLNWCLPEIVMHERQFQMVRKGLELLPSVQKLETLLGHNLNITAEIIEERVRDTVGKQITNRSIQICQLVLNEVDWASIITNSAYRRPPFEIGEKEKGFRDALIAETFMQIVSNSPTTPRICRIALVTGDKLLSDAVRNRTEGSANVRILASLEELKSLINTLVAEVTEEFVAGIQEQAKEYFFIAEDKGTLYYLEKVRETIREKFSAQLEELAEGASKRKNSTWRIGPPRFVKKERQRVFWASRITVDAEAYTEWFPNVTLAAYPTQPLSLIIPSSSHYLPEPERIEPDRIVYKTHYDPASSYYIMPGHDPSPKMQEVLVTKGKSTFEVIWSVIVTAGRKFRSPRIESVAFVETSWGA